jgi:hypothetical protein
MVVAAVYVFICSFPLVTLIHFCSLFGGTWRAVLCEYVLIRPIFSFLRPGVVLLHTSKGWLVPQTFGKSSVQIFCLSWYWVYVEVTAVIIFDTVHQALITHTGGCISFWSRRSLRYLHGDCSLFVHYHGLGKSRSTSDDCLVRSSLLPLEKFWILIPFFLP